MEIPISWRSLGTFDFSPSFLSCSPWRCVIPWVCPTPSHRQKGPPAFLHAHCDKRSRLGWSTEAGVEIVFDVSTRKKWLQKGTKLTYNKRAIWIYFGFPSIFFFFSRNLQRASFWLPPLFQERIVFEWPLSALTVYCLFAAMELLFQCLSLEANWLENLRSKSFLTPQSHVIVILTSRKQC